MTGSHGANGMNGHSEMNGNGRTKAASGGGRVMGSMAGGDDSESEEGEEMEECGISITSYFNSKSTNLSLFTREGQSHRFRIFSYLRVCDAVFCGCM